MSAGPGRPRLEPRTAAGDRAVILRTVYNARYQHKLNCQESGRCEFDCESNQPCLKLPEKFKRRAADFPARLTEDAAKLRAQSRLANRTRRLARDLQAEGFGAAADLVHEAIREIEGRRT